MNGKEIQFSLEHIDAIVGLGNPGPQYRMTRHNIGFLFVEHLAQRYGNGAWNTGPQCLWVTLYVPVAGGEKQILLVKPQTYMNNSGLVYSWLSKQKCRDAERIVVVHDELEKKFGAVQLRLGGSARGHNGLRSFITVMGEKFWRLRIGIDRPAERERVAQYVLESFTKEEQQRLPIAYGTAARALGLY